MASPGLGESSGLAEKRLRRFSRSLWIVGVAVTAVIGVALMPIIAYDDYAGLRVIERGSNIFEGGLEERAWETEDPTELFVRDGVLTGGDTGGYLTIAPDSKPLRLSLPHGAVTQGDEDFRLTVHQGITDFFEPQANGEHETGIVRIGTFDGWTDELYVVPAAVTTQVWFSERFGPAVRGQWELNVEELEVTPLSSEVSGSGNALLLYDGDALSAKFTHSGTGIFSAQVLVAGERDERPIVGVDDFVSRASWARPGPVLFIIEADTGNGTWTATVSD